MTRRIVCWRKIYEHQRQYAADVLKETQISSWRPGVQIKLPVKVTVGQWVKIPLWSRLEQEVESV